MICVGGADAPVTLDGEPIALWEPVDAPAGSVLDVGTPADTGLRTYVAFRGGIDAPLYHGSASTFTLGGFGGITGKAVATGDVLGLFDDSLFENTAGLVAPQLVPVKDRKSVV